MDDLKVQFIKAEIPYTGRELKSHFAYDRFDMPGDSLVAFCGGCRVETADLVDLADAKADAMIFSELMLHFIGEFFDRDLERTILKQRILLAIMKDEIESEKGRDLRRIGDDIFEGDAKLTVSIATLTPVSTVLHTGINVISDNTPVRTKGLSDYGIEPKAFAERILEKFKKEMADIRVARCKVRGVL